MDVQCQCAGIASYYVSEMCVCLSAGTAGGSVCDSLHARNLIRKFRISWICDKAQAHRQTNFSSQPVYLFPPASYGCFIWVSSMLPISTSLQRGIILVSSTHTISSTTHSSSLTFASATGNNNNTPRMLSTEDL